jgi:glycosyltransferase involved in cell wall biosynthesis
VSTFPRVPYADPWAARLADRRREFLAGSHRIVYYYTRPDTSTFRYRVFNMVEALALAAPDVSATWLTEADGRAAIDLVEEADLVVVCRALYAPHVAALIARARALGKTVLFDVDDLIFDDRYVHLIMETLDQSVTEESLQVWFALIARCGATLRLCDGAITTNDFLAERIREFADIPAWVIPNFMNEMQLRVSESARAMSEANTSSGKEIRIGYFSGTPTHNKDFEMIEPAVARLLGEDSRVRLRVVGFLPPSELLVRFSTRVEVIPLLDFVNLQLAIADVDINLVPLQDNVFTNSKSDLKYFEAAAVGTVSVASPVFTLQRSIEHGVNGFLSHAQDWHDVLRKTVGENDLPRIAERARVDATRRYSPAAQAVALRDALLEGR